MNRRYLNATIMAELCAIAKAKDAELLSCRIHDLVERNWRVHQAHEAMQASDLTTSIKRIAQAAHALDQALRASSEGVREAVRINLSCWPKALDDIHADIAKLAAAADQIKRRRKPWAKVKGHFIEQLISDAKRAGGGLTLGKTGSLVRMLENLKPYLPPGMPLSFATVKRIRQEVRKKKTGQK